MQKIYCLCFKYLKTVGWESQYLAVQYVAFSCACNFHLRRELPGFYSSSFVP